MAPDTSANPDQFASTSSAALVSANPRQRVKQKQKHAHANGNGNANANGHGKAITNNKPTQLNGHTNPKQKLERPRPLRALRRLKRHAIKHTWSIPLALLLTILSAYALNPTESNILHHFIFLSYASPSSPSSPPSPGSVSSGAIQYGKGKWDIAFVTFYALVLTFTREFVMQRILSPFASSQFAGIKSRGKQLRCMEQMYTALYFGIMGPAGLYVMRQTPVWYFRTAGMYEDFPHKLLDGEFKFYYLFEAAYWAQQALVMLLGLEKPRKDFKELVCHHIITLALIGLSYRFHFTHIGVAVYVTHDISDFFLAVSFELFPC